MIKSRESGLGEKGMIIVQKSPTKKKSAVTQPAKIKSKVTNKIDKTMAKKSYLGDK